MIGIGVIGYGYWGPNLVRNFHGLSEARVVSVADRLPERLAPLRRLYPSVKATTDPQAVFNDPHIEAVAIATPVSTHFDLAMRALRADQHVLITKPLAASSEQVCRLLEEADRRSRVLMVDHTFVYTGAVRRIQELVASKSLGNIYYYDSVRVNLGLFQSDVNVIWDLAVHDLSILDYVLPCPPYAVAATGMSHLTGHPENIAYLTLFFEKQLMAHIHVNWLSPVKVRRTLLGGSRRMIVYDDLEPSEKIKVYDKGVSLDGDGQASVYQTLMGYRTGDMWAPHLDTTEALKIETRHFLDCIRDGVPVITNGQSGLRIVRILEAASESLRHQGRLVELNLNLRSVA
jgi:predicted dehydrogenase